MLRVWADRIGLFVVTTIVAFVVWIVAYEITVGARHNPRDPSDGKSRWALVQQQFSGRDMSSLGADTVLLAPSHFWRRVQYPGTRDEALKRGGIAVGVVFAIGAALFILTKTMAPAKHKGDASFGTVLDAAKRRMTGKRGIILGVLNGGFIRNADPAHLLIVGPTRSGKGTGFILPNGYDHDGSFVFWDVKRENFDILSRFLRDKGVKVFLFSPGSASTHRYNPLDFIRRDENMPTDCMVVAGFLVPERADDTWSGSARMLLSTLIGYVLTSPNCEGSRHLRGVARMTTTGKDVSSLLARLVKSEGPLLPRWIVDGFNQYVALEPETRNSAVFNVNMAMNPWNNPLVSASTATSDFDLREFRQQRMAVFVHCGLAELVSFRPVIRIMFQQIHDLMMNKRPSPEERHEVLIMLDEFYHLGRMDSLITKITISAGYKFRMAIIIQSLSQLDELYGKAIRASTLAGSQVKLFLAIDDLETANYVSELLGDRTIKVVTPVRRAGAGWFTSSTENIHYEAQPLRNPQELREMDPREAILVVRSAKPFVLRILRHYEDSPFAKFYARYHEAPMPLPQLERWKDRDMGPLLAGRGTEDAKPDKRPVATGSDHALPEESGYVAIDGDNEPPPEPDSDVRAARPAIGGNEPAAVVPSAETAKIDDVEPSKGTSEPQLTVDQLSIGAVLKAVEGVQADDGQKVIELLDALIEGGVMEDRALLELRNLLNKQMDEVRAAA